MSMLGWSTRRVVLVIWNGMALGARFRGTRIDRVAETSIDEAVELEPAIASVLRKLAAGRRMRSSLTVAVGPEHYRLKRVPGGLTGNRESTHELDGVVARFAVVESRDEWIASLRECSPEGAWLFLVNRGLTETLQRAVMPARCTVQQIVPIAAALAAVIGDGDSVIDDQGHVVRYTAAAGRLISHRRTRSPGGPEDQEIPRPQVLDGTSRDALLSAVFAADVRDTPSLSAWHLGGVVPAGSRARRRAAVLALAASSLWTVAAPIAVPLANARRLERELLQLSPRAQRLASTREDLSRATQRLSARSAFRKTGPAIELLAAIADRLPEGVAISSWRLDSSATTLVLLGPQAAGSLVSLAEVPGLQNGRIEGGVSRESVKEAVVERATLVFDVVDARLSANAELSRRRGM